MWRTMMYSLRVAVSLVSSNGSRFGMVVSMPRSAGSRTLRTRQALSDSTYGKMASLLCNETPREWRATLKHWGRR
jgi:hypothetical protein